MTRVTLTSRFSELNKWPGRLLEAASDSVVTTHTSGSYIVKHGAGSEFANYSIKVTGTGFKYYGDDPYAGTIKKLVVLNNFGQVVLTLDQFGANPIAKSLSQLAFNIFGSREGNDGPSPDGQNAMSHLLAGNDTINGTNGDDRQILPGFNQGNDVFNMKGGDDQIGGSMGNDTIYGGAGFDTITFRDTTYNSGASAVRGINVNMNTGKLIDVWGYTDKFTGIEAIEGSRFNDYFKGSAERDTFSGLKGNDTMDGGAGKDRILYDNDFWQGGRRGIVVDLEVSKSNGNYIGRVTDGFGDIDKTINIERVIGTRYADKFIGSGDNNVFSGGEGKDNYNGMGGSDTLDFSRNFVNEMTHGINVDLTRSTNQVINDGFGNKETAKSIEEIWGSRLDDRIKMKAGDNYIWGNEGADTMTGGGGHDSFEWGWQGELGQGDVITDFRANGVNERDKLAFDHSNFDNMTTTVKLVNGTSATSASGVGQFVFNSSTHTLSWDSNGSASGGSTDIVFLQGVSSLSAVNFELF